MADDDLFERYVRVLRGSLPTPPPDPLRPTDRLADLGLSDSVALVQLIVQLEEAFHLDLPDELLTADTFESVDSLWLGLGPLLSVEREYY